MSDERDGTFPRRFGKYTLIDRVAEGGMAEIYLAVEDNEHAASRFVTIKRIRSEHATDPDYNEFFLTEGRVSLACAHPNLPQVFELGQADGSYYLAMEYIRGHTLLDLLRGAIRAQRLPSLNTVLCVAIEVAAALEHVHGLRAVDGAPLDVIHRDVTPQNIMLTAAVTVKLIDFGIVRSTVQTHKTRTGIVKGKFAYMAPEQINGYRTMDQRADLFALGIVMWESLAARPLFRRQGEFDTIEAVRTCRVPALDGIRNDVPQPVFDVVCTTLRADPNKRYQNATHLLTALEAAARDCGLVPSRTDLRAELLELCGAPAAPQLPKKRRALGSESDSDAAAQPPRRAHTELIAPAGPKSGISRDPLLLYFLRKAGVHIDDPAPAHPDSDATAAADS